jgi:SNF2 family DNA or RNA helicase
MANLRVTLGADRKVVLTPSLDTDNTTWINAQAYWTPQNIVFDPIIPISIPISDFSVKKMWLRTHWVSDGHTVEVDDAIAPAIQNANHNYLSFQKLISKQSNPLEVEIGDLRLKRSLTAFQTQNVANLTSMTNGADFSVPGAGKTATNLVVWAYLRHTGLVQNLVVICPKSSIESWMNETESVLTTPPKISVFDGQPIEFHTEILIVNFERLDNAEVLGRLQAWMSKSKCQLVIDEAHRLKSGQKSVRWNACNSLRQFACRVDLLTGTPMTQSLNDLRNLFSLSWDLPVTAISDDLIRSIKRDSVFVRTTKGELGLPPVKIHSIGISMSPVQAEIYRALRSKVSEMFALSRNDEAYFGQRGKAVMTLLSVASNPGLLLSRSNEDAYKLFDWPPRSARTNDPLIDVLDRYAKYELPSKYRWIVNFLNEPKNSHKKVVIWSSFVGNLLSLAHVLSPLAPAVIYGSIDDTQRKSELMRFREMAECKVLLTNPQTLGEGISLHHTSHDAIYLDRTYNAGQYLQSVDRIHRLGLPNDTETNVYLLQSLQSIDEHVNVRLSSKIQHLADMMNDPNLIMSSLPNVADYENVDLSAVDNDDFTDLLKHLKTQNS